MLPGPDDRDPGAVSPTIVGRFVWPCCPPFLVTHFDPAGARLTTCPLHPGGWFSWQAP